MLQVRHGAGRRSWLRCLGLAAEGAAGAAGQQSPMQEQPQPWRTTRRGLSSLASLRRAHASKAAAARSSNSRMLQPQFRSMFIQTEATPNPESLKYLPGQTVLDEKYGTGMVRAGRPAPWWPCLRIYICMYVCGYVLRCSAHAPTDPHASTTPQYFRQGDKEVSRSPLAKKLLKIPGVQGVFLGREFITITKTPDIIWQVRAVQCSAGWDCGVVFNAVPK